MGIDEQLAHLDNLLLTSVTTEFPDPLTDTERATVNAYIVLAHAVIEEYIEDRYLSHFDRLSAGAGYPSIPEASVRMLVTHAMKGTGKAPNLGAGKTLRDLAKAAKSSVEGVIKANNGIKSTNIEGLSKAIGINWVEMDGQLSTWIADLEALGGKRGEAGHLSPFTDKAVKLSRQDYPDDVRVWVKNASIAANEVVCYMSATLDNNTWIPALLDRDGN